MGCGASKDGSAAAAPAAEKKEEQPAAAPAAERKEEAAAPAAAERAPAPAAAAEAPAAAAPANDDAPAVPPPKLKRKPEATRAAKPAPPMTTEKPVAERRWTDVKALLPRKKTAEDKAKRQEMWKALDVNGNGLVSLAEFDKYARETLKLDTFTNNLSPVLIRAFNAAKAIDTTATAGGGESADDYISFAEFRLLLVNLASFFELMEAFDDIDTSDDRRVSIEEFKAGLPKLQAWGVVVANPDREFKDIDTNGAGQILFAEFAAWGMSRRLDVDGDPDDDLVAE